MPPATARAFGMPVRPARPVPRSSRMQQSFGLVVERVGRRDVAGAESFGRGGEKCVAHFAGRFFHAPARLRGRFGDEAGVHDRRQSQSLGQCDGRSPHRRRIRRRAADGSNARRRVARRPTQDAVATAPVASPHCPPRRSRRPARPRLASVRAASLSRSCARKSTWSAYSL